MARVIFDWDKKYKRAVIVSDFLESIRGKFSVPNENKKILKKTGRPTWYMSDFDSPISNTGRFDIGLYFEIVNGLKEDKQIEYEIITTDLLQEQLIQTYSFKNDYEICKLNLDLRPYQESGVKKGIHMGYGIMIVGTAGGKTLLMASLIETIRRNSKPFTTLVILPSNLVSQTYKEFINYGINKDELAMWDGDNQFIKAPIVLASVEILRANLTTFSERNPKPVYKWKSGDDGESYEVYLKSFAKKEEQRKIEWNSRKKLILNQLEDIDLILIDEVHGLRKGNVFNDVIALFQTRHKYGFTGTMPPNLLDQWNIIGNIGPILINVDSAALREMNYVSQVKAQILQLHYKNTPSPKIDINSPTKAYDEECTFLYHNDYRNKVISKIANNFKKNALIMVDSIDHGETLERLLKEQTNKKVYFIRGSVEMDDREKLRSLMEIEDNIICVAMSRIFAVGINIKNLHYVVFAQGGKAKVTLIQSIGRGLRLHDQKDILIIVDIADATHYGLKHMEERISYYKSERIEYEIKELVE